MRKSLVIAVLIVLATILVYSVPVFEAKLRTSSFLNGLFSHDDLKTRIAELEGENRILKEQCQKSNISEPIKVYSSLPFSSGGKIAIAAGRNQGIENGDTIVYAGNIFIGTVTEVLESSSIVTTIFDPSWEIAVRIGEKETDALMNGGTEINLTLIPRDEPVGEGEKVFTASSGLPYGLEIGFIEKVYEASGGVFKEAAVRPSFQLKALRNVEIYH